MRKRTIGSRFVLADTHTRVPQPVVRVEQLDQMAEDRELENLGMIYELEYKLERMAGYVSSSLDNLREVPLAAVDQ